MNIKTLQRALVSLGHNVGKVDGLRGRKTINATKQFQKENGLVADGVAGSMTIAAIKTAMAKVGRHKNEPDKTAMSQTAIPQGQKKFKGAKVKRIIVPVTSRNINHIIYHCAATPEGKHFTVKDITAWHKQRGWNRCGYHFVILLDGTIQAGCPIGQIGIHTKGKNTGSVGIGYIGGMTRNMKSAKDTRTPAQVASSKWLISHLCTLFPITRINGHNQFAAKACPSFDMRKDVLGNLKGFKSGRKVAS